MKNLSTKLINSIFILIILVASISCMDKKSEDSKKANARQYIADMHGKPNEKDVQFLVNAAEIHREEISLGQLAQEKSNTDRVNKIGKMMEKGHAKSLSGIVDLSNVRNITLPESHIEKGDSAYKKLKDKSGSDFDKAYLSMVVSSHKDAISIFEAASTESLDPALRDMAFASLPKLKAHLKHALVCQKECEKM